MHRDIHNKYAVLVCEDSKNSLIIIMHFVMVPLVSNIDTYLLF